MDNWGEFGQNQPQAPDNIPNLAKNHLWYQLTRWVMGGQESFPRGNSGLVYELPWEKSMESWTVREMEIKWLVRLVIWIN